MKRIFYCLISLLALAACDDPNEGELFVKPSTEASTMSMTDILESQPETYSLWLQFLKHADFYNAMKDANAKATVFCPNNEAVTAFLQSRGVQSVTQLPRDYARKVVQNHIINKETIGDSALIITARDGASISAPTLFKEPLTLSYGYKEMKVDDEFRTNEKHNSDVVYINNHARIGRLVGVSCGNGKIFTMADVITPNADNIVEKLLLESGEGNTFQIFANAIKADAEIYKMLTTESVTNIVEGGQQVITYYKYTCFATPDNIMHNNGVTNVDELKQWLVNNSNGEETDGNTALHHYLLYHLMGTKYSMDQVFNSTDGETLIYDTKYSGQAFICDENKDEGKRLLNKDIPVLRSDIEASNGYITKVGGMMPVYHPSPVNVKWDFMNSPDIIQFVNNYSLENKLGEIFTSALETTLRQIDLSDEYREGNYGELTSFRYKWTESKTSNKDYRHIGFCKDSYVRTPMDPKFPQLSDPQHSAYMNNFMVLNLGFAGWVEFDTPTIIAGKYKVVLHYLNDNSFLTMYNAGTLCQFNLDGTENQTISYLYKGAKTPSRKGQVPALQETLWSEVEFDASTPHTFKITMRDIEAKNASNYHLWLDFVEFIPIQ